MKSNCKICGKEIGLDEYGRDVRMIHIFDYHIGDFLAFVENRYLAKLIRKAVLRCYE